MVDDQIGLCRYEKFATNFTLSLSLYIRRCLTDFRVIPYRQVERQDGSRICRFQNQNMPQFLSRITFYVHGQLVIKHL